MNIAELGIELYAILFESIGLGKKFSKRVVLI